MTQHFVQIARVFRFVFQLVAIATLLVVVKAPAQLTNPNRALDRSVAVTVSHDSSGSAQTQAVGSTTAPLGVHGTGLHSRKAQSSRAESGSVSFHTAVTYDAGGGITAPPGSLAVADVNGDGKPDLIVANTPVGGGVSSVGVLLGNGDGTFQPVLLNTSVQQVGELNALAVVDVNGDGKLDLIVVSCCESNGDAEAAVLLGNGDGTFRAAVTYDAGGRPATSVAVGDVNGDGRADIVMVNWNNSNNSTVDVLLGNGDGTFQPFVSSDAPPDPGCAALADMNGDGKPDLLTCSENSVTVQLGNGDGTFQTYVNHSFYAGYCNAAVLVADVNGDGVPDMAVPNSTPNGQIGCSSEGFAGILSGNGDGTFNPEVNYLALGSTHIGVGSGAIGDLNGDGKIDVMVTTGLATSSSAHGSVGVLLGNGDGTFQTATSFDTGGPQAQAVVAADLNGDGKADIVVANFGSGTVGVLLNGASSTNTTTTLTSSKNPEIYKQPVTFTAVVTSTSGTPTGTVVFRDGNATIASKTLVNGTASITTMLARGWDDMTAEYLGSGSFNPSTSAVLYERVDNNGLFSTRIHESSSNLEAFVGAPVTFTVSLSSALHDLIPQDGDPVYLYGEDGSSLGSGTTQNGVATVVVSFSKARHLGVIAYFPGDDDFQRAGTQVVEDVIRYPTAVHLTSSLNPAVYGQAITFTATVTSRGPNTPTGIVKFKGIGEATLSGGVAILTKTGLRAETHAITADYVGDDASAPSASAVLQEVVTPASTTTALTSSANPSSSGQSVTFTATVTSSTGLDPFGTVTFSAGGATLGTVALKNTVASVSTNALPTGTSTITATYNGSGGFTGSSTTLNQTVQP